MNATSVICTVTVLYFIIISICLTVLQNIALGKPAEQSATLTYYGAEYAVDGNRGTDHIQDKCAHTGDGDTNPWWRVDLLDVYTITSVRILNRGMDKYGIGKRKNNDIAKSNYNKWGEYCCFNFVL